VFNKSEENTCLLTARLLAQRLLFHDTMNVLIVKHVDIEGPGLIELCLKQRTIPYRVICLETGDPLPKPDAFTHIVLLGGPMNVYEEDRYPFLRGEDLFIKEAIQRGKHILGICLGAQLIAKALGATVTKSPVKEIGWCEVSLTEEGSKDPLLGVLTKAFPVFQWHEDTFEIPKWGTRLATSAAVPNQAFRYGDNAYGLQFHLEVTPEMIRDWTDEYGEASTSLRTEIMTATKRESGNFTTRGARFLNRFFGD
jgi:GMP synthase-like glutamine amidotransferase